ncbi:NADH-quinone oxidoreductase subunit C [Caminibacter mediatlanticus]|uniref:Carbon monoxide-induced hydrogenase, CooU subunit n=1 Tax=Caminibacter mediatlanticus TB-2 TaxID=391592 RepID=A0AAI9AII8_9BACT|nr:NADH-quinone oxidoreductase subunit C [Caminibacter mediatlanticus]EDM24283.1 carbon monoxide-induced hydrogenase, CooU subunit [Caminibacter mediatlanticus TB-2]
MSIKEAFDFELREVKDKKGNIEYWAKIDKYKILDVAKTVKNLNGRCVIITAYKEEIPRLVYHFDVDGVLINIEVDIEDKRVDSITPILKSASWAEREFKEMYGIEPINHPNPKRLFLDDSIDEEVLARFIPLSKAMSGNLTSKMWHKIQKENNEKD